MYLMGRYHGSVPWFVPTQLSYINDLRHIGDTKGHKGTPKGHDRVKLLDEKKPKSRWRKVYVARNPRSHCPCRAHHKPACLSQLEDHLWRGHHKLACLSHLEDRQLASGCGTQGALTLPKLSLV